MSEDTSKFAERCPKCFSFTCRCRMRFGVNQRTDDDLDESNHDDGFGRVITMDPQRFAERVFRSAASSIAHAKSVLDQYEDCWCPAILGPEVLDILAACDVLRAKLDDPELDECLTATESRCARGFLAVVERMRGGTAHADAVWGLSGRRGCGGGMSYTVCAGCGAGIDGDIEVRRFGSDADIDARLALIAISDNSDYDTFLIDGDEYTDEGFAVHTAKRCRDMRRRPDCGHSRDCDLGDERCGWCADVDTARKASEEATRDLLETIGRFTAEVMREFGESESFCIAVMSRVGQKTAAWMRADRENG